MDLADILWLRSAAGQQALAAAAALPLTDASALADLERLRQVYAPRQAAVVVETVRLRRRAAAKFAHADQMYFTRDGLEQAAGEAVAAHTAARFAGISLLAELGCGIGGDTLALARVVPRVIAVDRDPVRLALAQANLAVHGLADRVSLVRADVTHLPLGSVEAIFVDPARRSGSRRLFRLADLQPPYALIAGLARQVGAAGVKVAPGIADAETPPAVESEFVSHGGELKAALLWHGALRTAVRRASLLPSGLSLASDGPPNPIRQGEPAGYLYEPDPALIRAHLLDQVAARLDGWQIDPTIAYLCAARRIDTPMARAYAVREWFPFGLKTLSRRLRALEVGQVTIKKRGSPLDPQALQPQLRLSGPNHCVVVLTRVAGRPAVIVCQ